MRRIDELLSIFTTEARQADVQIGGNSEAARGAGTDAYARGNRGLPAGTVILELLARNLKLPQ